MDLFIILGGMTAAALVLLAVPLLRRHGEVASRAGYDIEIYRDQLRELEHDVERGVITDVDHATARTEIERRMLAAASDGVPRAAVSDTAHLATSFVFIALPLVAGSLYLWLGAPDVRDQPFAARESPAAAVAEHGEGQDVEALVESLAERLQAQPDDVEGWVMLGRTYNALGRYDDAVTALSHAAALADGDANIAAMLG